VKSPASVRTGTGDSRQALGGFALSSSPREERFNRLYADHYDAVRAYVWRRDPALCDDVVAETFLVAWRRLDEVPASTRPWLIGVARRVRLNLRRGARRRGALEQRLDPVPPAAEAESSPWSLVVHAALAQLSEQDREVLLLSVWDDLDRAEVARVLGCSKANVSVRLHRARRRLAQLVEPDPPTATETVPTPIRGGASDGC
jgi:RNA polymerase sigma factor (sigma-70 family)